MPLQDGLAALNLEMPPRVPRTEYSVASHWPLLRRVTGLDVGPDSPEDLRRRAQLQFVREWQFDFWWSTLIGRGEFQGKGTSMGHAVYADGGADFDTDIHCPFSSPEEVLAFDPAEALGPVDHDATRRRFEQHYRANRHAWPDMVHMTGVYVTCISGLIDLFGWEMLLLAAGTDLEAFGDLANRYADWIGRYFLALADADVPVVMVHDDIVWTEGPFLSPDWYRRYVFPSYRRFFGPLRDTGKKVLFTSDGNYTGFIDDIAAAGADGFVMEPATDMARVAEKYGRTHVFIGNADTRILLLGSKKDIRAEVERCMAIGKGCPGFFLAVGNHIPANTPVENCLYYNEVYRELSRR